ncbi:hypothetical protein EUTSA_v10009460mg [Eutrema salsugineum]|uniref:Retrotransposon Copia-like N-terminal domain-containing protein n=1 Tax=Eutrema salsugineum TaxID=72664 RepID=V4MS92_EUTSA|nr:hypothetical protein EUTSA_v10009460mg [Eutrema salsugineum]
MAESKNLSPEFNPHSPYYIDPFFESNFDLQAVILSKAEDNYVPWKLRLHAFLRVSKKIGFIDGTLEKPDRSSPLYKPWKQCDSRVKYWLMISMSEELQNRVMMAKTAHKMWGDIRWIFIPNLDLKIYQVRRKILSMRQGCDSVDAYFGKVTDAWMELSEYEPVPKCACGCCKCEIKKQVEEAREKEMRYAFLMGLNKSLSFMTTVIMLMNPLPSLNDAYLLVKQAESDMNSR